MQTSFTNAPKLATFDSLPWAKLCFVDVETTGSAPGNAGVTEIAVVSYRLKATSNAEAGQVTEWSTLINPGHPIPPEIRFLTGISNEMVRNAPTFLTQAQKLEDLLENSLFVAHHARFDHGFIKHEFERIGKAWPSGLKTLCTVRLSRLLDADRSPHSLDAIRLRYRLPNTDRHRALGDAQAIRHFFEALCQRHGEQAVLLAIKRLMLMPSLPAHLPPDSLENIPHAAGVYIFWGEVNAGEQRQALYVGKSVDLRTRVASHFGQDHRSERGIRLASEIRAISHTQMPDELCALIKEQQLVHELQPSHNVALRKKQSAVFVAIETQLRFRQADSVTLGELVCTSSPPLNPTLYGPFSSKATAKLALIDLARAERLCLPTLGLERRPKRDAGQPCFAYQLGKCRGACAGKTLPEDDWQVLARLAAPKALSLNASTSTPSQLADGQWVKHCQLFTSEPLADDFSWHERKFDPAIYNLLKTKLSKYS